MIDKKAWHPSDTQPQRSPIRFIRWAKDRSRTSASVKWASKRWHRYQFGVWSGADFQFLRGCYFWRRLCEHEI